jgi:tetratricopeptide (TPR) repeat protein
MPRFAGFRRFLKSIAYGSPGWVHYVFAFVFLVRLIALARLASSPLLFPSGSDTQFYDDWAKQILHGHWTDHQAFYGLPLYPFLLAFLYRVFGYSPFVPGLFQAGFDAGTATLIYKITVCLLARDNGESRRSANVTGIIAAIAWGFFIPAQAYSAILMPTAGAVFAFWLLVWQLVRSRDAPSSRQCFVYGIVLGFVAMAVATVLFLIPLFVVTILFRHASMARKAVATALLALGIFVGTAPCWLHNCFVARDPVFLSAHSGINLWLGNNPAATGYPRFPSLHAGQVQMLRESIDQAEVAMGRPLKRSEVSRYWADKARDYILSNFGGWLQLLGRKLANFWNAFEYDDLGAIVNLREHRVLFPGLHFGLVAELGLAGGVFSWRAFPASRWIAAAIALQLVAILPVFVTERYRLPVVPGLLALAAAGLYRLWKECVLGNFGKVALQVSVVALASLFVAIPRHDPSLWALEAYNAGRFALQTGNLAAAEIHLQEAQTLVANNAETNFALGNLRFAQGDSEAARDYYHAALQADPQHKGALNNLGVLALNQNDAAQALDFFRKALSLEPRNPKTHYLLAKALDLAGDRDQARTEAARAVELDSTQPEYLALKDRLNEK